MADYNIRELSDEDLKKEYSKSCDELDTAEDNIRVFLDEINRREAEKNDKRTIPVSALKDLLGRWDKEIIPFKEFMEELRNIIYKE